MDSERKILVTGASGFLGSNLLERLNREKCFRVYALSSRAGDLKRRWGSGNICFFGNDVLGSDAAREMFADAVVFNCAFPRNSTGTGMAAGLRFVQEVFEAAVRNRAKAIVNISSQSVYSPQRTEPATEKTPVSLESTYAVGKYATELMLGSLCKHGGGHFTNIRMASLIGPGFEQRIVNRLARKALETGIIEIEDNRQHFGFLDVADAVDGLCRVAVSDASVWHPVYNLGSPRSYTLREMASLIVSEAEKICGIDVGVRVSTGEKCSSSALDSSLFVQDFGPCFETSLAASTAKIIRSIALAANRGEDSCTTSSPAKQENGL